MAHLSFIEPYNIPLFGSAYYEYLKPYGEEAGVNMHVGV